MSRSATTGTGSRGAETYDRLNGMVWSTTPAQQAAAARVIRRECDPSLAADWLAALDLTDK